MARTLGVAVIGYGWMGRVHAQAYARLAHHYPQLGARPRSPTLFRTVSRLHRGAPRPESAYHGRMWNGPSNG